MAVSTPTLFGTPTSEGSAGSANVTDFAGTPAAGATLFAILGAFDASVVPTELETWKVTDSSGQADADTGNTEYWAPAGVFQAYDTGVSRRQSFKVFRKRFATSPGSITVTGTTLNQNDCTMGIISVVSDNPLAPITNFHANNNAAGDPSMTLPNTPGSGNYVLGMITGQGNNSFGAVTGWTELVDSNWSSADNRRGVLAYNANDASKASYAPTSTNTYTTGIIFEIKEIVNGNVLPYVNDYATNSYGSATGIAVNAPANVDEGDLLVIFVFGYNTAGLPIEDELRLPTGFHYVGEINDQSEADLFQAFACAKVADATDAAASTFQVAAGGAYNVQAMCVAIKGSTGRIAVTSVNGEKPANTTRTWLGVTTPRDNCLSLLWGWDNADNTTAETTPTGGTKIVDMVLQSFFTVPKVTAGATGDYTNTCNAVSGTPRGSILLVVEPSITAGGSGVPKHFMNYQRRRRAS